LLFSYYCCTFNVTISEGQRLLPVLFRRMLKDKYIDYLRFEKRYSAHTILAYHTDLDDFTKFLSLQYSVSDLLAADHTLIRSWLISLIDRKISPRSVNRKLSTLKSFYRYCQKQGLLKVNPMLKVVAPRVTKQLPVFLTHDNLDTLLKSVEFELGYEGCRDKMIITLFYATGIRRAELVHISISDLDLNAGTLKVLGKRNKERIVPLGSNVITQLEEYLIIRNKFLVENSLADQNNIHTLFVTSKGLAIYPRLIQNIVHEYLSRVASNSKLSPHVLRHTFATHMLDDGADLNAIKEILGHSSLAATQVYTHNTIEKLKSIYKQAHPRA
jgi:integrase/recombinase XerC